MTPESLTPSWFFFIFKTWIKREFKNLWGISFLNFGLKKSNLWWGYAHWSYLRLFEIHMKPLGGRVPPHPLKQAKFANAFSSRSNSPEAYLEDLRNLSSLVYKARVDGKFNWLLFYELSINSKLAWCKFVNLQILNCLI